MKRLFLAAACICLVTAISPTYPDRRTHSTPFPVVAFAGHTVGSSYCEDGTPGCLPGDPGTSARPIRNGALGKPAPASSEKSRYFALGSGVSLAAVLLLTLLRMRI